MPQAKYRLFCRASGMYYQQDTTTGEQVSLRTKDKRAAQEKLRAANESLAQHNSIWTLPASPRRRSN